MGLTCSIICDYHFMCDEEISKVMISRAFNKFDIDAFLFGTSEFEAQVHKIISKFESKKVRRIHLHESNNDNQFLQRNYSPLEFDEFSYIENNDISKIKNSDVIIFCRNHNAMDEIELIYSNNKQNLENKKTLFFNV